MQYFSSTFCRDKSAESFLQNVELVFNYSNNGWFWKEIVPYKDDVRLSVQQFINFLRRF